ALKPLAGCGGTDPGCAGPAGCSQHYAQGAGMTGASENVTAMEALNMALHDALASDDKVFLIGEDIADREGGGVLGVTKGLSARFGEHRVRATPISEQAIIG